MLDDFDMNIQPEELEMDYPFELLTPADED